MSGSPSSPRSPSSPSSPSSPTAMVVSAPAAAAGAGLLSGPAAGAGLLSGPAAGAAAGPAAGAAAGAAGSLTTSSSVTPTKRRRSNALPDNPFIPVGLMPSGEGLSKYERRERRNKVKQQEMSKEKERKDIELNSHIKRLVTEIKTEENIIGTLMGELRSIDPNNHAELEPILSKIESIKSKNIVKRDTIGKMKEQLSTAGWAEFGKSAARKGEELLGRSANKFAGSVSGVVSGVVSEGAAGVGIAAKGVGLAAVGLGVSSQEAIKSFGNCLFKLVVKPIVRSFARNANTINDLINTSVNKALLAYCRLEDTAENRLDELSAVQYRASTLQEQALETAEQLDWGDGNRLPFWDPMITEFGNVVREDYLQQHIDKAVSLEAVKEWNKRVDIMKKMKKEQIMRVLKSVELNEEQAIDLRDELLKYTGRQPMESGDFDMGKAEPAQRDLLRRVRDHSGRIERFDERAEEIKRLEQKLEDAEASGNAAAVSEIQNELDIMLPEYFSQSQSDSEHAAGSDSQPGAAAGSDSQPAAGSVGGGYKKKSKRKIRKSKKKSN